MRPRASRTTSARGTSTSTSIRASSRSGSAIASAAISRSRPCATRNRSITSNSAAARPSIRDDDAVLDHELRLGVVRARSPRRARARATASTSSSRRSSFAAREAKRADRSVTDEALAPTYAAAASRTNAAVSGASQLVEPPRPRLELGRRRAARAAAPCRSRAAGRRARRRARRPARGCRRAAGARPRGRPRPGAAASPASPGRRPRRAFPRARPRASPRRAASPDGVSTRSGRREPSG